MKLLNTNKLGSVGKFGEDAAIEYLRDMGYDIVARNTVYGNKEIDIIVTDMKYIVFVEVKTRTVTDHSGPLRFGTAPANAVDAKKKEHIKSAARLYLKEHKHRKLTRFDIIEVYLDNEGEHYSINRINHIPRAFGAGIDKR